MPSVQVKDATVWFDVVGQTSGPCMVLVSGTGGNMHSNWDHLVPLFGKTHRVVLVDYSGSGNTSDSGGPLTVSMLAEQVMAAADVAGCARFDVVGYSLGTSIAMTMAATHPERIRSMVLLAGFSDGTGIRNRLQTDLWLDLIRLDPRSFARLMVLNGMSPARISAMSESDIDGWVQAILTNNDWAGIARQIHLDRTLNVTHLLGQIRTPTLVIGCIHDQVIPISHARELARRIAGSSYAELDAGHFAPFEQADAFGRLVVDFVAR